MKNILITGSTDGIGKMVAQKLAGEGNRVYVHGRSQQKVNTTIEEIKQATNNENITGFVADLSDLQAVKQMTDQINEQVSHIDVLINNAGVFKSPEIYNKEGMDMRFVVNYLAPYQLTNDLLPLLKKRSEVRIVNLSSAAQSDISYDAMMGRGVASVNATYAQSKLALTMWSFYLAQQLDDIAVIAVNPGSLLNTKMANEAYGQYWSPADKGSEILYDLAVGAKHQGITGKYFDNDSGGYGRAHAAAYDERAIMQLIEFTKKIIG